MKIDLITGLLGSGKTTFIKGYVGYLVNKNEKVCILENDYGAVNVDMMILKDVIGKSCDLEMISGGCDYDCHIRRFKTKLIQLRMLGYDRVIVEPSGIFDPEELFDILNDEPLCNWYEIGSIITIVDAKMDIPLELEYYFVAQTAPAGIIVVSKIENEEDITNKINTILKEYQSDHLIDKDIILKSFDKLTPIDFNTIESAGFHQATFLHKNLTSIDDFNSVYVWKTNGSLEDVQKKIQSLYMDNSFGNVSRVKGFVLRENNWYEINATKNEYNVKPIKEGQEIMIVIGANLNEKKIQAIFME